MDITHYTISCERGSLHELTLDHNTVFSSRTFKAFMEECNVQQYFWCGHIPSGKGTWEKCYKTVKWIATRKWCSIQEAVYWYNTTLKDNTLSPTAPVTAICSHEIRLKGIDSILSPKPTINCDMYKIGDLVWVKLTQSFHIYNRKSDWVHQSTICPGRWHVVPCQTYLTGVGSIFQNKQSRIPLQVTMNSRLAHIQQSPAMFKTENDGETPTLKKHQTKMSTL